MFGAGQAVHEKALNRALSVDLGEGEIKTRQELREPNGAGLMVNASVRRVLIDFGGSLPTARGAGDTAVGIRPA